MHCFFVKITNIKATSVTHIFIMQVDLTTHNQQKTYNKHRGSTVISENEGYFERKYYMQNIDHLSRSPPIK